MSVYIYTVLYVTLVMSALCIICQCMYIYTVLCVTLVTSALCIICQCMCIYTVLYVTLVTSALCMVICQCTLSEINKDSSMFMYA